MVSQLTNSEIISWLEVCCKGYVKPDTSKGGSNSTGTVTDTKNLMPVIFAINAELASRGDLKNQELVNYLNKSLDRSITQNNQ